jgi:hypothetical protein
MSIPLVSENRYHEKIFQLLIGVHPETNYMNSLKELVKKNNHGTSKSRFISKLETISCVFPAENSFVNALIPFIGVRIRQVNV